MNQAVAQESYNADLSSVAAQGGDEPVVPFSASGQRDDDIENTRQELLKKLRAHTPVKDITHLAADRLNDRYTIHISQPLPALSYGNARAYAATDDKGADIKLFATVCDPARPYRFRVLHALEQFEHPHLVRMVDHGIVNISALGEYRYVILFEQPEGRPLSEILREGRTYNERSFAEQVLKPLASVVTTLGERGLSHCRITPENIFIGEKVTLGECISEPAGFSKHYYYEPIERLLTSSQGACSGTTKTDVFDLGVLALDTLFSFDRLKETNKETYTGQVLTHGTYNVLTQGANFSEGFADLLIGTLNDNYEERWGSAQLNVWLGGKRFNLLKPSPPREASRPIEFDGEQFFSPRALAQNFFSKWEAARNVVREIKIDRWMDQGLHKREMADMVRRAINATGGPDSKNPKQNNELLARLISVLDPSGPIRLEHVSFSLGGLGLLIADAMRGKKQKELGIIRDIIEFDLLNFWTELQPAPPSDEAGDTLWRLQKNRHFLMLKGMGFGMERILYDLNPHLPCMSSSFAGYHIASLPDMLYALDSLASSNASDISFVDRHLAAFLASHAGIMKEVAIKDLRHHAYLLQNPEITVMVILAKAQEKTGIKQLKGLSYWTALRMLDMVKNVHSAQTRKAVCRDISAAADQGHIGFVLQTLLNMKVLNGDVVGFEKAQHSFQINRARINELQNPQKLQAKSAAKGYSIASAISLLMLSAVIYSIAKEYFFY